MKARKLLSCLAVAALAFLLKSCRERGCTDPKAINYNVTANEDDGSCIVCQENEIPFDSAVVYLQDHWLGSPHYYQKVIKFSLQQVVRSPNDRACGKESSQVRLLGQSQIGQGMFLNFNIYRVNGPVIYSANEEAMFAPYETKDFGWTILPGDPPFLGISLDSLNASSGQIIYF
jgi:hypothetical protein